jgi:6-phospho-3-hexuloisomerase
MSTEAFVPADTGLPHTAALAELSGVLGQLDRAAVDTALALIAASRQIALYGVGREGLQVKGFAMRLHHLGLAASVVGDMACPPLGHGDLLIVSAGPGSFSTVQALIDVAREAGAKVLVVTAQAQGSAARAADAVIHVPAQTMADDHSPVGVAARSVLPMGSLYEGALYLLFELMILRLREHLQQSPDAMRARHTNLE